MQCPKCQFEDPDTKKFCGEYGANQKKFVQTVVEVILHNINSTVNAAIT